MNIKLSEDDNGVGKITISNSGMDHRFEIIENDDIAVLEYHESCGPRGNMIVAEPPRDVVRTVVQSDEVTEFLDCHNLEKTALRRNV